jgi:prophage regulatory protein
MDPANEARFIRLPEILARTGMGKTKIYGLIKHGQFPAPRHIGRSSVWHEKEFRAWLDMDDRSKTIAELV